MPNSRAETRARVGVVALGLALLAAMLVVLATSSRRDPRALVLALAAGVSLSIGAMLGDAKRRWPTIVGVVVGTACLLWGLLS